MIIYKCYGEKNKITFQRVVDNTHLQSLNTTPLYVPSCTLQGYLSYLSLSLLLDMARRMNLLSRGKRSWPLQLANFPRRMKL